MTPRLSTQHTQRTQTPPQASPRRSASTESTVQTASWYDGYSNASTREPSGTGDPNPTPIEHGLVRNLLDEFNAVA